jgi:hypothetical protein
LSFFTVFTIKIVTSGRLQVQPEAYRNVFFALTALELTLPTSNAQSGTSFFPIDSNVKIAKKKIGLDNYKI